MSAYTYSAFDKDGRRVCGVLKSKSEGEVEKRLKNEGLSGYKVYKSETRFVTDSYKNVPPKELFIFCRQMSVMFISQVTIMEGVLFLAEQTENKQLKIALTEIHEHMSNGYTFSEAMKMYGNVFNSYLLSMVIIGETSGTLDNIFVSLAGYFEKEYKTRKKMKSAIAYPAILTVLMAAIVLFLILTVLPMFQDTLYKMGGDIPEITKVILAVSTFMGSYLPYITIGIIALAIALNYYFKTKGGAGLFDKIKVSIPVGKYVYSRVITARLARSLSILLKSGVQLLNAFDEVVPLIDNKYIEGQFANCVKEMKEGLDVAQSLSKIKLFPMLFLKMVAIGQSTGHLDEALDKSAGIFDDEVEESLEYFTLMIEPILIIILSVIVGIILVSVMLPMISIMNNIG